MPKSSYLVFLDRNEITDYKRNPIHPNEMKSGLIVPNLPSPLENSLRDAIHTLARILTMQVDGIQPQQQQPGQPAQQQPAHQLMNSNGSVAHYYAQQQQQQQQAQSGYSSSGSSQYIYGNLNNTAAQPQPPPPQSNGPNYYGRTASNGSSHSQQAAPPQQQQAIRYPGRVKSNNSESGDSIPSYARHSTANRSTSSVMSGSSAIGTHNSMFISREYTLQAFRTMFAVLTKLLFLSAHHQFGNSGDNEQDGNMMDSLKAKSKDKWSKSANSQFVVKFRATVLFQSFFKYYKRINGENDPHFKRLYLFYKENEGHGKHFARRQLQTWENEPFDRKLYDKEIFKINREQILALENRNNENRLRKLNEIAAKRSKKFKFPSPEFEMLDEVKQFLARYVWRESRHRRNGSGRTFSVVSGTLYSPRSMASGAVYDPHHQHGHTPMSGRRGSKMSQKSTKSRKYPGRKRRRSKHSKYGDDEYGATPKSMGAASGNIADIQYRHNLNSNANGNGNNQYPKPLGKQKTDTSDSAPLQDAHYDANAAISSASPQSNTSSELRKHKLFPIESSRRGSKSSERSSKSKKHKKGKKKRKGRHVYTTSNQSDVTEQAMLVKIDNFVKDVTEHKDDEAKRLELCLEMEKRLQDKIANAITNTNMLRDAGSIDKAMTQVGFKANDANNKGFDFWRDAVYDAFKLESESTQAFIAVVHNICGNSKEHKSQLKLLRAVVDLFDEQLSVAGTVRSDFFNKQASTNSDVTGSQEDDWGDESDEDDSEEDESEEDSEEESTEEEESKSKKKKKKAKKGGKTEKKKELKKNNSETQESDDWDEESDEDEDGDEEDEEESSDAETGSDDGSYSSSSSWNSNGNFGDDDVVEKDPWGSTGKFPKLDEFALDDKVLQYVDERERIHNQLLGEEGIKFLNSEITHIVGGDFFDEYIMEKWKYQIKLKKQHIKVAKTPEVYQMATVPACGPNMGPKPHPQSYTNLPQRVAFTPAAKAPAQRSSHSPRRSGPERQRSSHHSASRSPPRSRSGRNSPKTPRSSNSKTPRSAKTSPKSPPKSPKSPLSPNSKLSSSKKKKSRSSPKSKKKQQAQQQHVQLEISPNFGAHAHSYSHPAQYHAEQHAEQHDMNHMYQQPNMQPYRNGHSVPRNAHVNRHSPHNGHNGHNGHGRKNHQL